MRRLRLKFFSRRRRFRFIIRFIIYLYIKNHLMLKNQPLTRGSRYVIICSTKGDCRISPGDCRISQYYPRRTNKIKKKGEQV